MRSCTTARKSFGGNFVFLPGRLLMVLSISASLWAQGWPQVGFNGQRLNTSPVPGPGSLKPTFETLATGITGGLYAIGNDGALLMTEGHSVSAIPKRASSTGR